MRTWDARCNCSWRCGLGNAGNSTLGSAEALAESAKHSVRAKVEHPFLRVKRVLGYAKSLPSTPIGGALPETGKENEVSGAAIWLGQPADGGRTTDRVTWALWVQTGPGGHQTGPSNQQRPRCSEMGGRTPGRTAPKGRKFLGNPHGNRYKSRSRSCSEFPQLVSRSGGLGEASSSIVGKMDQRFSQIV